MKLPQSLDPASAARGTRIRRFYEADDESRWGRDALPEFRGRIEELIRRHLSPADCVVELGCGRGALQGVHPQYVALDLSFRALRDFFPRTAWRVQARMERLPFLSGSVSLIVTVATLEHIPQPEQCLAEIERVLRPSGMLFLAPAWFCRPWAARGLHVRNFHELSWRDRLEKLTVPARNHILFRAATIVPKRLWRELELCLRRRPLPFRYRRLDPNLDDYITSDSDAFASMDPHMAILYFLSRGYYILSAPTTWQRFWVRHVPVVVRKPST